MRLDTGEHLPGLAGHAAPRQHKHQYSRLEVLGGGLRVSALAGSKDAVGKPKAFQPPQAHPKGNVCGQELNPAILQIFQHSWSAWRVVK